MAIEKSSWEKENVDNSSYQQYPKCMGCISRERAWFNLRLNPRDGLTIHVIIQYVREEIMSAVSIYIICHLFVEAFNGFRF